MKESVTQPFDTNKTTNSTSKHILVSFDNNVGSMDDMLLPIDRHHSASAVDDKFSFAGNYLSELPKAAENEANMKVSVVSSVNNFEDESVTSSVFTDADGIPKDTESD